MTKTGMFSPLVLALRDGWGSFHGVCRRLMSPLAKVIKFHLKVQTFWLKSKQRKRHCSSLIKLANQLVELVIGTLFLWILIDFRGSIEALQGSTCLYLLLQTVGIWTTNANEYTNITRSLVKSLFHAKLVATEDSIGKKLSTIHNFYAVKNQPKLDRRKHCSGYNFLFLCLSKGTYMYLVLQKF